MVILRLAAMLAVAAMGASVLLYLFTRQPKYLRFAWVTAKVLLVGALTFFALMVLERLAVL